MKTWSHFRSWRVWIGSQHCWRGLRRLRGSVWGSSQYGAIWTHRDNNPTNNNKTVIILLITLRREEERRNVESHSNLQDKITYKPLPASTQANSTAPSQDSTTQTTTKSMTTPFQSPTKRSASQCAPPLTSPNRNLNKSSSPRSNKNKNLKQKVFSICYWNQNKIPVNNS